MSKEDKVTLRDVYNAVGELRREMGVRIDKIEEKTDKNENAISRMLGYASAISFVISLSFALVWKKIIGE